MCVACVFRPIVRHSVARTRVPKHLGILRQPVTSHTFAGLVGTSDLFGQIADLFQHALFRTQNFLGTLWLPLRPFAAPNSEQVCIAANIGQTFKDFLVVHQPFYQRTRPHYAFTDLTGQHLRETSDLFVLKTATFMIQVRENQFKLFFVCLHEFLQKNRKENSTGRRGQLGQVSRRGEFCGDLRAAKSGF